MTPHLTPALANNLLVDLLCTPMAMRADRHSALVLSVAAAVKSPLALDVSTRGTTPRRAPRRADDGEGDGAEPTDPLAPGEAPEVMPWDLPLYEVEQGVAEIEINGPLVKGYDAFTCWCFGAMSLDRLQAALDEIAARTDVLAVVLVVRSPGGMATGTPETAAQVAQLAATKLVVAVTDSQCCSAAYWIASAASTVFTTGSADVGSVGTYIALYDYTTMLDQLGIKLELFKRGKYKAIGVMGNPLDEAARAFLDHDVQRTNDSFVAAVRAARPGVPASALEGQWFDGAEAVENKLADEVVSSVREVKNRVRAGVALSLAALSAQLATTPAPRAGI